jgi:hypothetical protein
MSVRATRSLVLTFASLMVAGCAIADQRAAPEPSDTGLVAERPTSARAADGTYISWREHIIDDESTAGPELTGGDGSLVADFDGDGYMDIVSVHESDTEYDGEGDGLIRIAFGTSDPDRWSSVTLGSGAEVGAPEDVAVGDLNGDGYVDIVAACELAHLIYFENPGANAATAAWTRHIPEVASNRGSFIRVYLADLTGDGRLEVVAPNKGAQNPTLEMGPRAISWFSIEGSPLLSTSWVEHELTRVRWPINAQPVDLDGDGDLDVVGGSVAERRIMWFENVGTGEFSEHRIDVSGTSVPPERRTRAERAVQGSVVTGFNMDYADLNGDGRLDIVLAEAFHTLVWLEQPTNREAAWTLHTIGTHWPDQLVGLRVADINSDGRADVLTGGYSRGPRDEDADVEASTPMGRLAWFEQPTDPGEPWIRHDISRRQRGMFDQFVPRDMDGDGDVDFITTRGNSAPYDGVLWLEQVRSPDPVRSFQPARVGESPERALPPEG